MAVVLVFMSLSLAQSLAKEVDDQRWINAGFVAGMFLIVVAIVTQGLRVRPGGIEIGIGLGILTVYLLLMLRMKIPTERSHLIEYSVIALSVYEALRERSRNGRGVRLPGLLAVAITTAIGMWDELAQLFVPGRVFDLTDILFNFLAATIAVVGAGTLAWVREVFSSKQ